ncbi:MAG: mannose-1-phosphate guanyltransferase [Chloroflexota bacterium]|nr:mannose-1-phosphate guanyltransferase [Chloroflexota bacterium]
MKAVVMAGGQGTRLRPLTINRPKPMVPMVNKPVIGHILDLLKRDGITDVVLTLHYMAETVEDYFGDGQGLGMHIEYSVEETPLGTAGSVKQAQEFLDEAFIVISGDAVTDFDLQGLIAFHEQKEALATITLYHVENPLEYGVVIVDEGGRVQQFLEKPSWGEVISDTVNTGIYLLEPEVLDYFDRGVQFDFSKDLFPLLLENGDPLYGYVADGYWCDVGNLSEYTRASGDMLLQKVQLEPFGEELREGLWVGEEVQIAPDAELHGPIFLGDGVEIKQGVVIHGPTVVGDYSVVDRYAYLDRSVIWRNCYLGESVEIRGAIIGQQCSLKQKVVVFEGATIGDSTVVGEGAVIRPNVKIWPRKEVEAGATVNTSIIWGAQARHVLFGRYGVTGLVNVDLTPEFAARLGAAFGATLPKGATVTINRDPHRSPRMLKRGMISGLPSSGVNVLDLRSVPIPVARYITRIDEAAGGIHVRLSPYDSRVVDIKFFDANGQDLAKDVERNIERGFFREDYRRVYLDEIATISYDQQVVERYSAAFLASLDLEAIRGANPYIVVDYANAPTAQVLAPLLRDLNCRVVALNETVDEFKMSISPQEFQNALDQLGKICHALDTWFGVRLDVGGERVFVSDCQGTGVEGTLLAAALAIMALKAEGGGIIAVPVSLPTVFEEIASAHGGEVIRTAVNPQALMKAANRDGVIMAADGQGSFIWPAFQPVVDGMMTVAKIVEFLIIQNTTFAEALAAVPSYHMAQGDVDCPWESKGTVMRLLNQEYRERLGPQIDGVRIQLGDEEWVLVLPDADHPVFHIYAQARSDDQAHELVNRYQRVVEGLQA